MLGFHLSNKPYTVYAIEWQRKRVPILEFFYGQEMMHIRFEIFFASDATRPLAQKTNIGIRHQRYIQETGFS